MGTMHVYKLDEGVTHWVFAPNKREAMKFLRNWLRSVEQRDPGEIKEAFDDLVVERLKPDKKFAFDDDGSVITKTIAEWIAERGQKVDYFACSEY